jgi:hypothetical protein
MTNDLNSLSETKSETLLCGNCDLYGGNWRRMSGSEIWTESVCGRGQGFWIWRGSDLLVLEQHHWQADRSDPAQEVRLCHHEEASVPRGQAIGRDPPLRLGCCLWSEIGPWVRTYHPLGVLHL